MIDTAKLRALLAAAAGSPDVMTADDALLAAAANALPSLLDELEALRAKLHRYEVTPGLAAEYGRLDANWQEMVAERDKLRAELDVERLKPLLDYEKQAEAWRTRAELAEAECKALRADLGSCKDHPSGHRRGLCEHCWVEALARKDEQLTAWRNATYSATPADLSASVAQSAIDYAEMVSAWRQATGCDTPEEAGQRCHDLIIALGEANSAAHYARIDADMAMLQTLTAQGAGLALLRELESAVFADIAAGLAYEAHYGTRPDTRTAEWAKREAVLWAAKVAASQRGKAAIAACRSAREGT